jgi:glycosyltransferase involved in cell wall biosynthesis
MTVALLGPATSIHLINWANSLSQSGVNIHVISQHPAPDHFFDRILLHWLPYSGSTGYLANVFSLRRLLRIIKPDILHAHFASGYGTLARLSAYHPFILSVWGSDIYVFPRKNWLARAWLAKNLKSADVLLSTSNAMASATSLLCGIMPRITPFGIDLDQFSPSNESSEPFIVSVRALEDIYGIDILLKAFSIVVKKYSNKLLLRIIGEGSKKQELMQLATSLGVGDKVVFMGRLAHEDIPSAMRGARLFAVLSRSESFCVAALEAQSMGIPVVASAVGGLPEVVIDGRTGFLVPPEDYGAAADRIFLLLADMEIRKCMSSEARTFVAEYFEHGSCINRMVEIYKETLHGKCLCER